MGNIVITWRELLLVGGLIIAIYIAELVLMARASGASTSRWGRILQSRHEKNLREDISALNDRIAALEAQLNPPKPEAEPMSGTPYTQAIQMARQGAAAGNIAEICGLSRSEADFIVSVHGVAVR